MAASRALLLCAPALAPSVRAGRRGALAAPEAPPEPLRIQCFGPLEVYRDGKRLSASAFARGSAVELLKLLVLQGGRPLSRERIAAEIFPDREPESAIRYLHVVVHALRKALEPGNGARDWRWVRSTADGYYFAPDALSAVDLWRFRESLARARAAETRGKALAQVAPLLEEAVALYRGDLFADGGDSEAVEEARRRVKDEYVDALFQLARLWAAEGNGNRAITLLRQAVAADPVREEAHARLMRTLLDAGRPAEALAQYRTMAQALRRFLGVEPRAETQQLLERMG